MDQGQNNDLQQAIDNVANGAQKSVQDQFGVPPTPPMDSDGMPEMALGEPMAPPMPEGGVPQAQPLVAPEEPAGPSAEQILATEAVQPAAEQPSETNEPSPAAPANETPETPAENAEPLSGDLVATKENILKDLMPLMDRVQSTPEEKFQIYRDAMETLHDKNIITDAYKAASKIEDENQKAEALISLMKAIDNV